MTDSLFAISNQSDVERLKENSKNQNNFKSNTNLAKNLAEPGDRMFRKSTRKLDYEYKEL